MRHLALVITLVCSLLPLSAQGKSETVSNKKVIAVTIVPEETFVRSVASDEYDIVVAVPPGSSPESYEPTPKQRVALSQAEIYFAIGVPSEAAILPVLSKNTKVVHLEDIVDATYPPLKLGSDRDPHIWLSPKRSVLMVDTISEELGNLHPENASLYKQHAQSFTKEIMDVDGAIKAALGSMKEKEFVVYHPAFGYFAADYGLSQFALEEEGKEATPQHLAKMVDLAKEKGLKVIFYQAETDSRQSMAFAEEIKGVAVKLDPLSGAYLENLKAMASAFQEAGR